MNKIFLLDADGVVIKPRYKYFSQKLSEENNIPMEEVIPFFKGEYKSSALGEVDLKEILPEYLKKWNWKGTVEEFLNYWFESEKDLDEKLLTIIRKLRQTGCKVCMVSDNENYRAKYLMENLDLKDVFDEAFFSCDLGVTKSSPLFFQKVAKTLGVKETELDYWDDDQKNLDVAKQVGIQAFFYEGFDKFIEKLEELVLI